MPRGNVVKPTAWEPPPERPAIVPGPFSTEELIPTGVVPAVIQQGESIANCLERAERGPEGWRVARGLRPEPLIYTHEEALNPCGRGFSWLQREGVEVWDAVMPSSWPDDPTAADGKGKWPNDPPESRLKPQELIDLAIEHGLTDWQAISWAANGFPGAPFETIFSVIGYPHVGALKNAAAYAERNQRDINERFVTSGESFPRVWPTIVDPMNIVVQNGKPRLTIDKTMNLTGRVDMPSYNEIINLEEEAKTLDANGDPFGRLRLTRVWEVARGAAILQQALLSPITLTLTAYDVEVAIGKYDLLAYFRHLPKQRMHVYQSGRCFRTLYGHDGFVNFGEGDAMNHACRHTDGIAHITKSELRRLDKEYPSKVPEVVAWLAHRLSLAIAVGDADDVHFIWTVLFIIYFYVDDGVLALINDLLFDRAGRPVMVLGEDGQPRQQRRAELYFAACIRIPEQIGHTCPLDKRFFPGSGCVVFGVQIDLKLASRELEPLKRKKYLAHLRECRDEGGELPNGLRTCAHSEFNRLVHRLLHASDAKPTGIAHLFHCRIALKRSANGISSHRAVIIHKEAREELYWWEARLEDEEDFRIPLATRYEFPGASFETTLVRYTDASREPGKPSDESGFGGWSIIGTSFLFAHGEWTLFEIDHYSINVLEAHAKDAIGSAFLDYVDENGITITHAMAYVDNSTAESIAERGHSSADGLNHLELRRQEELLRRKVHETSERVSSIENDVADWLSRGRIADALRVAVALGLTPVKITISDERRSLQGTPFTWA